jgi:hypothetical protein
MKKTLQDQYLLIKEGKGHTGVFLTEAKRQFPNIVRNAATFEEAAASLITKNIITENIVSLGPINSPFDSKKKESYELAFENFLAEAKKKKENEDEKVKAEEKKVSKKVEDDASHNFDNSDEKNPDNMIFDQIMMGYYAEMKDPKNADKTMQELKDMVFKNLTKDPIFYTKDGQFGVKGLGYTVDAPGLGEPKEAKGKYKASGYGDLKEGKYRTYLDDQHMGGLDVWQNEDGTWPEVDYKWNLTGEYEDGSYEEDSVEESKLRKVIREMVDGGIEEMRHLGSMFQSKLGDDKKEREERDPTDKYLTFDKDFEKEQRRKGNLQVRTSDGAEDRIFITKVLHSNLGPAAGNAKLVLYLQDRTNLEPAILGGKEVWKIKGAKINSKGYISVFVPVEKSAFDSLKESIDKELAAINKEAEHEIIASKLEKVQALIDKKQSQISRLDEDEDLKDLTDAKKVKEISKDIKSLEKAKAKLEKMMHKGKAKSPRKEVIDETDEILDEAESDPEDIKNMAPELEKMKKTMDDMSKIEIFEDDETLAAEIKEKAEQYYEEYGTLEDVLREFKNEDEKEFAKRHLTDAYGL